MYFILAFPVGNEKGKDEADTVDCCPHAAIGPPNFVIFDFFCEDSIDTTTEPVFKNFMRDKQDSGGLFDCVNVNDAKSTPVSYLPKLPCTLKALYITISPSLLLVMAKVKEKVAPADSLNDRILIPPFAVRRFKYDCMKSRHALFPADPNYKKQKSMRSTSQISMRTPWRSTKSSAMRATLSVRRRSLTRGS